VLAHGERNFYSPRICGEALEVLCEVSRRGRVIRLRNEEERALLLADDQFWWNG
jgi:hypothetical protein